MVCRSGQALTGTRNVALAGGCLSTGHLADFPAHSDEPGGSAPFHMQAGNHARI